MSRENVELVRRIHEEGMQGSAQLLFERLDPDVEYDTSASGLPDAGVYRGPEQLRDARRRWWGAWEAPWSEPTEFIDAGDSVVIVTRFGGRGKGSGVEVSQHFVQVLTLSEGKITRVALYRDRREALEAVGLSE